MNTKPVYDLPEWSRFIFATADLKLLRQISIVRTSPFEKETYLSKLVSWPIVHLVIDKDIYVKMSFTPV